MKEPPGYSRGFSLSAEGEKPQNLSARNGTAKKCNGNGAGACMGADNTADAGTADTVAVAIPQRTAVQHVLFQKRVGKSGVTQQQRLVEVHAAGFFDLGHQQIIALLGAAGLAQ